MEKSRNEVKSGVIKDPKGDQEISRLKQEYEEL